MKVECQNCGIVFYRSYSQVIRQKKNYCSRDCSIEGRKTSEIKKCENCRIPVKREQNQIKKSKYTYCSRKCYDNSQKSPIEVECENCGKKFRKYYAILNKSKQHFCSNKCKGTQKTNVILEGLIGKKINFLTVKDFTKKNGKGQTTVICECICGKEVKMYLSRINKGVTKSCGCGGFTNYRDFFYSHTEKKPSGCVEWTGHTDKKGYARVDYDGKKQLAHRVAWILDNGEIPEGMCACHHCDNPKCISIDHIFISDHAGNMQDCVLKGRQARGEKSGMAKLTEKQVLEIRREIKAGVKNMDLAKKYNVGPHHIYQIKTGRRWCHVTLDNQKKT